MSKADPACCVLNVIRALLGKRFIKMLFRPLSQVLSTSRVLRSLGAQVGDSCHIASDICVYNLPGYSCGNLRIGDHVYIGPRCVFDLTATVVVEDYCSIGAQVTFITHIDVGVGPLKNVIPREEGSIHVRRGAWVGVNSTVLHGVTIEQCSMVGAMSLVNRSLPPRSVSFGIPCRTVRSLPEEYVAAAATQSQRVAHSGA